MNMEAERGAGPRGLRAVSYVCTLKSAMSAMWRPYYLKYLFTSTSLEYVPILRRSLVQTPDNE